MPKIVISYRRSDTQAIAGRIYDRLSGQYGDASVFMDIDKIPIGTDFRQYIRDELRSADLLLAVIGPRWLGARDDGRLRINDRADPVRVEIETALEYGMPVIPVLVEGASMPPEELLPDTLKDFVFTNAATVDIGRDYRQHMDRLIRGLDSILAARSAAAVPPAPPPSEPIESEAVAPAATEAPREEVGAATTPPATGRPWPRAAIWGSGLALGLVGIALYAATGLRSPSDPGTAPQTAEIRPPAKPTAPTSATPPKPAPALEKSVEPAPISRPTIDAASAPSIRWKLQSAYPVTQPTSASSLSKQIGALSNGRMTVDVFNAGELLPSFEIFDAVAKGVLDLGYAPGSFWVGKSNAFPLMSGIPFGFAPRDHLRFRHRADVTDAFDRLLAPRGVVALPCGSFGRTGEMWLKRSIATADDLRGMKLRVAGIERDIYKELGAVPTVLPAGEIYPALERGVIDGARLFSPKGDFDLGFYRVTKFYYYPGLIPPSTVIDLLINKKSWADLSDTGRAIITRACLDATDTMLEQHERADRDALAEMARHGVAVNPVPTPVARSMLAATRKVFENLGKGDPTFSTVMSIVEQMAAETIAAQLR